MSEGRVNRLLDMQVEEVSLVDRAANKRRFLIVKRSDDMDQNANNQSAAEAAENLEASEAGDDTAASEPETDTGADDGGEEKTGDSSALGVAVAALEGLTDAVEALSNLGGTESQAQLTELAGQFRDIAERLAPVESGDATASDDQPEPEGTPAGADQSDEAASEDDGSAAMLQALTSLKDSLQPLGALIASLQPQAAKPPKAASVPSPSPAKKAGELDRVTDQLSLLTGAMNTLAGMFKAQNQRLSQVEKRFGLPNSAPTGEGEDGADKGASWPFDINTPVDRESVDESVSFHDV